MSAEVSPINAGRDRSIKRLERKEGFKLMNIIKEHYPKSGYSDKEFAEWLNANPTYRKMFAFDLNGDHVKGCREDSDPPIPNNFKRVRDSVGDALSIIARVQALEEQMLKLTGTIIEMKTTIIEMKTTIIEMKGLKK